MCLKINRSVKTPCHRPSMGIARSGLWAPVATKVFSGMSIGFSGTFIVSKVTRGNGAEIHNKN